MATNLVANGAAAQAPLLLAARDVEEDVGLEQGVLVEGLIGQLADGGRVLEAVVVKVLRGELRREAKREEASG